MRRRPGWVRRGNAAVVRKEGVDAALPPSLKLRRGKRARNDGVCESKPMTLDIIVNQGHPRPVLR